MIAAASRNPPMTPTDVPSLFAHLAEAILGWEMAKSIRFNQAWFSETHIGTGFWRADWFEFEGKDQILTGGGEDHSTIGPLLDEIQQIARDHDVALTHVATPSHPDGTISVWWTDAGGTQRHARALLPDIQEGPRKSPTNTHGRARPCQTHRR